MRNEKNPTTAVLLGLLLGPFGMFYSTTTGALVMLGAALVLGWTVVALPFIWIACPIWAYRAAVAHNDQRESALIQQVAMQEALTDGPGGEQVKAMLEERQEQRLAENEAIAAQNRSNMITALIILGVIVAFAAYAAS